MSRSVFRMVLGQSVAVTLSQHIAQGTEGPLGPQWSLALGAEESLSRVPGGMILTGGSGGQVAFVSKGNGEFNSPTGDAGLTLLEKSKEGKTIFTLSDNGSVTTFELPVGSSGSVWMPSSSEGPNGTSTTLKKFKLANGVIEQPTEECARPGGGLVRQRSQRTKRRLPRTKVRIRRKAKRRPKAKSKANGANSRGTLESQVHRVERQ